MPILLRDEEIIGLVTEYHFSGIENRHVLARNVARAQLKKVVEWLGKPERTLFNGKEQIIVLKPEQWKALKKEAGIESIKTRQESGGGFSGVA